MYTNVRKWRKKMTFLGYMLMSHFVLTKSVECDVGGLHVLYIALWISTYDF
jgi:hypothetical protein